MSIRWKSFFRPDGGILAMIGKDGDNLRLRFWYPFEFGGAELKVTETDDSFEMNEIDIPSSPVTALAITKECLEAFWNENKFYDFSTFNEDRDD